MIGCDIIYELIFRGSPAEEHPPKGWECSPVAQIRLISSFHRVKPGHRYLRSTAKVERGRHAVNLMDVVSLLENAFSAVAAVFAAEFYGMFFSLLATSIRPLCDHIATRDLQGPDVNWRPHMQWYFSSAFRKKERKK